MNLLLEFKENMNKIQSTYLQNILCKRRFYSIENEYIKLFSKNVRKDDYISIVREVKTSFVLRK